MPSRAPPRPTCIARAYRPARSVPPPWAPVQANVAGPSPPQTALQQAPPPTSAAVRPKSRPAGTHLEPAPPPPPGSPRIERAAGREATLVEDGVLVLAPHPFPIVEWMSSHNTVLLDTDCMDTALHERSDGGAWVALRCWRVMDFDTQEQLAGDGHFTLLYTPPSCQPAHQAMRRNLEDKLNPWRQKKHMWLGHFALSSDNLHLFSDDYAWVDLLVNSPLQATLHNLVASAITAASTVQGVPYWKIFRRPNFHMSFRRHG